MTIKIERLSIYQEKLKVTDFNEFVSRIGPPVGKIFDSFYPSLSESLRIDFISCFRAHYDSVGYLLAFPYEGIIPLLESIYSSSVYSLPSIVTNKPTLPTKALIDTHDLAKYFEHIIGIDYLAYKFGSSPFTNKSESIDYAINITRHSSDHLYIGDTLFDKQASIASNCPFLAVGYGYHKWSSIDKLSPLYVSSVDQLSEFLDC